MTKTETIKLLTIITAVHPRFEVNKAMAEIWYDLLSDINYKAAEVAVKKLLTEMPYAPTIADIRKQVAKFLSRDELLSVDEAWAEIKKAIRKHGYTNPEGAREDLGQALWQSVQFMGGWVDFCQSTEPEGVLRGHFIKLYEQQLYRAREERSLHPAIKAEIQALCDSMPSVNELTEGGGHEKKQALDSGRRGLSS